MVNYLQIELKHQELLNKVVTPDRVKEINSEGGK